MVDCTSSYNDFTGNFVMRVNGTGERGSGDVGFAGDGFWFGNPDNYVTNNIVSDLSVGSYGYGYEFYGIAGSGETGSGTAGFSSPGAGTLPSASSAANRYPTPKCVCT